MLQIGSKLNCPACGALVPPSNIAVTSHDDDSCAIAAACPSCSENFSGLASAVLKESKQEKIANASTLIPRVNNITKQVSENESCYVKQALCRVNNLSELFPPKPKNLSK